MIERRDAVRTGAIAGVVTIFFALVGLTDRFAKLYLVGRTVSFGRLILFIAPIVAGFAVTRARTVAGAPRRPAMREGVVAGAICGAVAGAVFGAFVIAVQLIGVDRVRSVFINVSPAMMSFVTFGRSVGIAALILTASSAIAACLAAGYRLLPDRARKPIGTAVLAVFVLGFLQRIVPISLDQLNIERDWLYSKVTGGLTYVGAALIAAIAAGLSVLKARRGEQIRGYFRRPAGEEASSWTGPRVALVVVALGATLALPQVVGSVVADALGFVLIFAVLALGLNIVVGYAGLLDLGYVFFFSLGAYALALLTGATLNTFTGSAAPAFGLDLNFWVAIGIVMAIAALTGVLIGAPVLRLRGDYLALVTLGLGEMATTLLASPWLTSVVGGPSGMRGVSDAAVLGVGFRDPKNFYYLGLFFLAFAAFVSWRLAASRTGRAWTAMREDEQIADAMGVSTTRYKLLAFALGGAIGSMGGALFAVKIGSLTPASFQVLVSIQVLGIVILGGMGSIPGVVLGALVLVGLPQLLREFEEYRLLAYGAAIIAIMILHPQGLLPNVRRSRELLEADRAQDKWAGGLAADEHAAPEITPLGEGAG